MLPASSTLDLCTFPAEPFNPDSVTDQKPTDIHVTLINWTIIEPGMYLLSACALSFKPLFRMLASGLHLQARTTHTNTTFVGSRSYAKKVAAPAQIDMYCMDHMRNARVGEFHSLSGDDINNSKDQKRIEVLVTKTVDMHYDA